MDLEFTREQIETYIFDTLTTSHPILKALNSGKLIIFVGAGMSVHLGLPSWRDFALRYLEMIYSNSNMTLMNFKTKESLKAEETKKLLSLCEYIGKNNLLDKQREEYYKKWFETNKSKVIDGRLYEKLYRLNAIYLTTNYDNALDLIAEDGPFVRDEGDESRTPEVGSKKVFFDINEFNKEILKPQNVIHVHGSVSDIKSMIISYGDYIKRYGINGNLHDEKRDIYSDFMSQIFSQKDFVVLFMGYGLEEIEILQFLFEGTIKDSKSYCNNRYLILPCFSDDYLKISFFSDYYKNNFGVSVIPCNMSEKGYNVLEDVLDHLLELSKSHYQENDEITELKVGLKAIEEMFL